MIYIPLTIIATSSQRPLRTIRGTQRLLSLQALPFAFVPSSRREGLSHTSFGFHPSPLRGSQPRVSGRLRGPFPPSTTAHQPTQLQVSASCPICGPVDNPCNQGLPCQHRVGIFGFCWGCPVWTGEIDLLEVHSLLLQFQELARGTTWRPPTFLIPYRSFELSLLLFNAVPRS